MEYFNTPTPGMSQCPAERLFGRKIRSRLPELRPTEVNEDIHHQLASKHRGQKESYDQRAKRWEHISPGQTVRMIPPGERLWKKAKVISDLGNNSFMVKLEDGRLFRRNRVDLRLTGETFSAGEEDEIISESETPESTEEEGLQADEEGEDGEEGYTTPPQEIRRSDRLRIPNQDPQFLYFH